LAYSVAARPPASAGSARNDIAAEQRHPDTLDHERTRRVARADVHIDAVEQHVPIEAGIGPAR
jgi:hypothetical protein